MKKRAVPRTGFALIEVIIAMFILSVVMSSLGVLMVQVAKGSFKSVGGAYRNGVLLQEVNRLEALPYDSLAVGTTTATVTALPYPHTRQVTITSQAINVKRIKLVITPSIAVYKRDSTIFTRTLGATTSAFNTQ
jgi:prepilin-type N-terminal cleavage/methylation domain-containing protein